MTRRNLRKEIMSFIKLEVAEKKADWGELRRVKERIIVKKGLPNLPSLIFHTTEGLSYFALIRWKNELRVYSFNQEGVIIDGQSFMDDLEAAYKEIKSKSKKVSRYPPIQKPKTLAESSSELDLKFKFFWENLAKKFEIPSKTRKNRPLIRGVDHERTGIDETAIDGKFIEIPIKSFEKSFLFTYYCLLFFLPSNMERESKISGFLIRFLLSKFPKFRGKITEGDLDSISRKFAKWNHLSIKEIFKVLYRISEYYTENWETSDIIGLFEYSLPQDLRISEGLVEIFCHLYKESRKTSFLFLSNILGIPYSHYCNKTDLLQDSLPIQICNSLRNFDFIPVLSALNSNRPHFNKGELKALKEGIQYQFSKSVKILSVSNNMIELYNRSDLVVLITLITQLLSSGTEKVVFEDKIPINSQSSIRLNIKDYQNIEHTPLRLNFQILDNIKSNQSPLFSGAIIT
ncbi:hypothetical protein [Candidatus Hodarchaeum mangrovi]